jgi:single-strand DNA-binding protein
MITAGVMYLHRIEELRTSSTGTSIVNIVLGYKYGRSINGKQPTGWIRAAMFGKRAESAGSTLREGINIFVTLSNLHVDEFEGRDGQKKSALVADLQDFQFLPKQTQQAERRPEPEPERRRPQERPQRQPAGGFNDDDDAPF